MKKIASLFFVVSMAALLFISCAKVEPVYNDPTPQSISVFNYPDKKTYEVNTALNLTGLIVTVKYSNGITGLITDFTTDPADGTILEAAGEQTVTVSYEGLKTSFKIEVVEQLPSTEATLKEISILQEPSKKIYGKGDSLDLAGLLVCAKYSDGKTSIVTDFSTDPAAGSELSETGEQTVTVFYEGYKATFTIKVAEQVISNEVVLEAINVYQRPVKISYETGDAFDSKGLIVIGNYSDGFVGLISDFTLSLEEGSVFSETGTQTITVYKGSLSTTFTVEVAEKIEYGTVSGINVSVVEENDIAISQEAITGGIQFTAPEGYSTYKWTVNSSITSDTSTFIFNTADLIDGVYEIFLLVKDENNSYKSATVFVQVSK